MSTAESAGKGWMMSICFCVGPQNGDPVCPCRMRSVRIKNGRYVITQDLGPVPDPQELARRRQSLANWRDAMKTESEPYQSE